MRFRLLPTDDRFFDLFDAAAANLADGARHLAKMIDDEGCATDIDAVRKTERRGDEITKEILRRLNDTFVTPFDREDIHELAEKLDTVLDEIYAVAERLQFIVNGRPPLPEMKQQADLLVRMAEATVELVARLGSMRGARGHLDAIDVLETEADTVYRQALARLFSGSYPALDVVRWKDIVEAMEEAINTVEDVSNVVESIVLKHA